MVIFCSDFVVGQNGMNMVFFDVKIAPLGGCLDGFSTFIRTGRGYVYIYIYMYVYIYIILVPFTIKGQDDFPGNSPCLWLDFVSYWDFFHFAVKR